MLKPYQIRISDELLNEVKESSAKNERSVNAEIRYLIKIALKKQKWEEKNKKEETDK